MTPQTPSSQPAGVSFYIWIISSVRLISIYSFVSNACSMSAMDRVNKNEVIIWVEDGHQRGNSCSYRL